MKAGDPGKVDRAREATTEFSLNEFKFLPKLRLGITTFNVKKCKIKNTGEFCMYENNMVSYQPSRIYANNLNFLLYMLIINNCPVRLSVHRVLVHVGL